MINSLSDLDVGEEDRLVRDSVSRMMQECRRPIVINGEITAPGVHSGVYLQQLEGLGLSELVLGDGRIDESTIRRIAIICEEAGAHLFVSPIVESLSMPLLEASGLSIAEGMKGSGLTVTGFGAVFGGGDVHEIIARTTPGGLTLSGCVERVPFAPEATAWVTMSGDGQTTSLLRIKADLPGIAIQAEPMADGTQRGRLEFRECVVLDADVIANGSDAIAARELLIDVLMLGCAAQLAGISVRVFQLACDHISTRQAFGRTLSGFQALQHRAADDYVAVEVTRAFLYQLCDYWDEKTSRRALLHALVAKASQTAIDTAKSAIQMHGAMGFTAEHELGWNLKAAIALATRYGDIATHRRHFADSNIAFW